LSLRITTPSIPVQLTKLRPLTKRGGKEPPRAKVVVSRQKDANLNRKKSKLDGIHRGPRQGLWRNILPPFKKGQRNCALAPSHKMPRKTEAEEPAEFLAAAVRSGLFWEGTFRTNPGFQWALNPNHW